jgi:hypothetical protein
LSGPSLPEPEPVPHPGQSLHRRVLLHRRPRTPHLAHLPAPDDPGRRRHRDALPLRPQHHRVDHPGAVLQPHGGAVLLEPQPARVHLLRQAPGGRAVPGRALRPRRATGVVPRHEAHGRGAGAARGQLARRPERRGQQGGGVPRGTVGGRGGAVQVRRANDHHDQHADGQVPPGAEADGGVGLGRLHCHRLLMDWKFK